jgi:hypothetical protein
MAQTSKKQNRARFVVNDDSGFASAGVRRRLILFAMSLHGSRKSLGIELHDSVVEDDPVQRRAGRVFERPVGQLTQSGKFMLASSDVREESNELRVEGLTLAGWCLVKVGQKSFKQRFLEIEPGVCRVYSTYPPEKLELGGQTVQLAVDVSESGEARTQVKRGGATVLDVKGSVTTARLVSAAALGGVNARQICNVTLLPREQSAVLWINGATAFVFDKRPKCTVELNSLEMTTTDHVDGHRLTCSKDGKEVLVIAVPEPLLLLRWIAALSSCDVGEQAAAGGSEGEAGKAAATATAPGDSVVKHLMLSDTRVTICVVHFFFL